MGQSGDDDDDIDTDGLRRRLYQPHATQADVDRYLVSRTSQPPVVAGPLPLSRAPRLGRRSVAVAGLVVASGVTAVAFGRLKAGTSHPSVAARSPTPGQLLVLDAGDGQVVRVDLDVVSGPTTAVVMVGSASVAALRYRGVGEGALDFAPSPAGDHGGQFQVTVVSSSAAHVRWRALRLVYRADFSSYAVVVGRGAGTDSSSPDDGTVLPYLRRPPTRLIVFAPPTVRWTAVVAVSPAS